VLIAVNQEDRVMLIGDRDNKLLGSVAVGTGPHEIAVSPEGRRAYVADSGRGPNQPGNTITVIDIHRRGAVATWKLGEHSAHDVVVSSDGKLVWAACAATRAVLEIDSATGKTLKTWNTGREGGWMLTASADDRLVFVAHLETGGVTRIERSSGAVTHVPTPEGEMGFAITPDGKTLWAANSRDHQVREIAAEGGAGATFASGAKTPLRVRFTSDGKRGVITHADPPQLTVFEVASRKIVGRVALPQRPKIVALSAEGTRAYISHPEADSVSVVDLTKLAVIGSIKTGKQPDGVAYAP
jgi:YVTN family beta-propeller protein